MKKALLPLVIVSVLALGLAAILVIGYRRLHPPSVPQVNPADLLPAGSLAYLEAPDLTRTFDRWSHTALHALWQEPEVQSFLQRPREKLAEAQALDARLARIAKAQPRSGFLAVTSLEGNTPRVVAGFSFTGGRSAAEELLAEPRAQLRQALPAGKADLVPYGKGEIQTYTEGETTVAESLRDDGWYFVANDLPTLQALLDRFEKHAPADATVLSSDEVFRGTLKPLPDDPEVRGFVRLEPLTEKILALLAANGQPPNADVLAEWKRQRGFGLATRIDGADFQDTVYLYAPGTPAEPKLPLSGIELTSPATFLYYAAALPPSLGQMLEQYPTPLQEGLRQTLAGGGTDLAGLMASFGSGLSFSSEWPSGPHPEFTAAFELAGEAPKLRGLLEHYGVGESIQRTEENGAVTYAPKEGAGVVLATTKRFLLAGLASSVASAIERDGKAHDNVSGTAPFKSAAATVPPPTGLFAYLNTAALVDHVYGLGRPLLAVALALDPSSSAYIDASKLPSSSTLVKHLGATALSRTVTPEGQMLVARGPITLPQLFVATAAAGAAAFPYAQRNLPPGTIPAFPFSPSTPPPAEPPAPAPGQ